MFLQDQRRSASSVEVRSMEIARLHLAVSPHVATVNNKLQQSSTQEEQLCLRVQDFLPLISPVAGKLLKGCCIRQQYGMRSTARAAAQRRDTVLEALCRACVRTHSAQESQVYCCYLFLHILSAWCWDTYKGKEAGEGNWLVLGVVQATQKAYVAVRIVRVLPPPQKAPGRRHMWVRATKNGKNVRGNARERLPSFHL